MKKRVLFIVFAFLSLSTFGQLDVKPDYTKPDFQGSVRVSDTLAIKNIVQMEANAILESTILDGGRFNLNANIFNEDVIGTSVFTGALTNGVVLAGFVFTQGLDRSEIYGPAGNQIQVKNSKGGLNDGFHTLTGIAYDAVNARTEYQWAGMVANLVDSFGNYTAYDGKSWRLGAPGNEIHNDPLSFQISASKDIYISTQDEFAQMSSSKGGFSSATERVNINAFDFTGAFANYRFGSVDVVHNLNSSFTTFGFAKAFPTSISSQNSVVNQGVFNSVILGGVNIQMKSDNTAYANQLGFNSGGSFETIINFNQATANRLITIPDKSGEIAVGSFLPLSGGTMLGGVEMSSNKLSFNDDNTNFINWNIIDDRLTIQTDNGGIELISGDGLKFLISDVLSTSASGLEFLSESINLSNLGTGTLTAPRSWTLPDQTGTIALTSDLNSYLPLAGGIMTGQLEALGAGNGIIVEDDLDGNKYKIHTINGNLFVTLVP